MLTLTDVCFSYDGATPVLSQVSFSARAGERIAICGPSGCGKTTLLRLICGLETPTSGAIARTEGERCSVVFQEDRLLPRKTALENAALAAEKEQAALWLDRFGLGDAAQQPVEALSGGMRRRVALARAAAFGGEILLLDEAFQGIDVQRKTAIMAQLKAAYQEKIILFTTHDDAEMDAFSTRRIALG